MSKVVTSHLKIGLERLNYGLRPKEVAVALILSAVVGYPLSIGPVAIFAPVLRIRADEFYRFYYPIYWASYKSELVDEFIFGWYCDDLSQDRLVRVWLKCFGADD